MTRRWRADGASGLGGLGLLAGSEAFSAVVGFGVLVHLARRLGPGGFADLEYASVAAGWALVVVRGGFDQIAVREAARRPALVGSLTDVLVGLRLASAVVGLAAVGALALATGRGWVVVASGLVLIPSALACDVGARASGRFGPLALAQGVRSIGLAAGAWCLVTGPGDLMAAALCVVGAEAASSAVLLGAHGPVRPRFRRRAWAALARRGAMAGATRFGRVSLYAGDVLALGWWASEGLGPYAAARRVAFALLAVGLVVPSAVAPRIARARGAVEARAGIGRAIEGLLTVALPATVGLMATSGRWMPRLFGEGFRDGGPWLALVAARLPFVLASNVQQAALVARRREGSALGLVVGMSALGLATLPAMAALGGVRGVALAALVVEVAGVVAGWLVLRRGGLAPAWHHGLGPALAGSAGVAGVCRIGRGWPLGGVVAVAILVYGVMFLLIASRRPARPSPGVRASGCVAAEGRSAR